jgi:hypothetical protein
LAKEPELAYPGTHRAGDFVVAPKKAYLSWRHCSLSMLQIVQLLPVVSESNTTTFKNEGVTYIRCVEW